MRKMIIFILLVLVISFDSAFSQIQLEPKLSKPYIQSPYKVIIEKVIVSDEIPARFTIQLKNNSDKAMSISNYKIEVTVFGNTNRSWVPDLSLEKPLGNSSIMPGQSIELVYVSSKKETLIKIDEGRLTPDALNKIKVTVYIKGEEGKEYSRFLYEGEFFWRPKMADLTIKEVKIEFLGYEKDPYYRNRLKTLVTIENVGNAYPILYGDEKELSRSLVKVKMVRKKDSKSFYLQMLPTEKFSIGEYTLGPENQVKLSFISDYQLPGIDIVGDFNIIVSVDEEIDKKADTTYYHFLSDRDRQNNIVTKTMSFNSLFDIESFYPKRVSILKPAGTKDEFPRLEQDLIYIDIKSYARLDLIDDVSIIKVSFNNESLRIFSIIIGGDNSYRVWFEKPKKVGKGKIQVEIAGITRFSKDDLEVTDRLILSETPISSKISWPSYFYASPEVYMLYFGTEDPEPPYGATPIFIDELNMKGNAPINISIALKSPKITWFDKSKGSRDIPPNADRSYYAGSNRYGIEVYIRPKDKVKWRFLEYLEAPVTIEPSKRSIVVVKLDELGSLIKGDLTTGENEILIQVVYSFESKERYTANQEVKEVIKKFMILSDMYWTKFEI